jgi:hypothetical protein
MSWHGVQVTTLTGTAPDDLTNSLLRNELKIGEKCYRDCWFADICGDFLALDRVFDGIYFVNEVVTEHVSNRQFDILLPEGRADFISFPRSLFTTLNNCFVSFLLLSIRSL